MTHEVLTTNVLIRQQLDRHRCWIESRIGTTLSDAVIFQTRLNLPQIGVEKVLGCIVKDDITAWDLSRLRSLVVRAEIPETLAPLLNVSKAQTGCSLMQLLQGRGDLRHRLDWQDCPVALTLDAPAATVVVMHVYLHYGLNSSHAEKETVLVTRRDLAGQVFSLLDDLGRSTRTPHLQIINGSSREVARCEWDQLTLSPETRSLLRDDFETFFDREAWYRKSGIPFRRGYLLHGPPGNGKSTAIRAMLSSRGLTAFTLRLFDPHSDEADLEHMFDQALKERPAMILFEDLDRAFPKTGECKSRISLQALLNALDGVGTGEGIVVVATANEPTLLDPAILKRPGRFDRLVHFADPGPELRFEYIAKLRPDLGREALDPVVQTSEGFSFAQLREAYVIAGQAALGRKGDIEVEDLLLGIETLRGTMSGLANAHAGGFR